MRRLVALLAGAALVAAGVVAVLALTDSQPFRDETSATTEALRLPVVAPRSAVARSEVAAKLDYRLGEIAERRRRAARGRRCGKRVDVTSTFAGGWFAS